MSEACHDFLVLEHSGSGFLVNRDQFFASVYLEAIAPLSGAGTDLPDYFPGTLVFREEKILVCALDQRLGSLFASSAGAGLSIALIADSCVFRGVNRRRFEAAAAAAGPDVSMTSVAFRIGSRAEIKSVPLNQIRLMPGSLRAFLEKAGLLGCRFSDRGVYFFIDIETICFGGAEEI